MTFHIYMYYCLDKPAYGLKKLIKLPAFAVLKYVSSAILLKKLKGFPSKVGCIPQEFNGIHCTFMLLIRQF